MTTAARQNAGSSRNAGGTEPHFLDSALDCIITSGWRMGAAEFNPASEQVFALVVVEAMERTVAELIIPPRLRERHREGCLII